MRTLTCFAIMPSGKNPPMRLVPDEKLGLCVVPSSCAKHENEIVVDFQAVYENIVQEAIRGANQEIEKAGPSAAVQIECVRGEDLPEGGNIVSQFLRHICRADITITDLTGLNPNVLLEYGIRLSVRDSLNILLCHDGLKLPQDVSDQRFITYKTDLKGASKAREDIMKHIRHELPALLGRPSDTVEDPNLFRRTVELATGRTLERRLAQAFQPFPQLVGKLVDELQKLDRLGRDHGDAEVRADLKLRYDAWKVMNALGETLSADPVGVADAIELYRLMASLEGFSYMRRDIYYKLNEICAANPDRQAEAEAYLKQAMRLDS